MTPELIATQIEELASAEYVEERSGALVDQWVSAGVGLEAVDPILCFMESHPDLDYGPPGALVHFVERFYRRGYEAKLIASIKRTPTPHTIWMLNRLLNGAETPEMRSVYTALLTAARSHPNPDAATIRKI